ncbi:MAG: hypothetical protein RLY61_867 [Candidatus Parcubacteria bacterium]|jgi:Zn finger protein HypA/HybF involved in hydrogenase expression
MELTTDPQATEFANKMILEATCSSKHTTYIASDFKDGVFRCRECSEQLYYVCCPKCESGYIFRSKDKELNLVNQTWRCDICKQYNKLDPYALQLKNYLPTEIPQSLLPKSSFLIPAVIALIILFLLILAFIIG